MRSKLLFDIREFEGERNGRFHDEHGLEWTAGIPIELHMEIANQLGHCGLHFQIHHPFANAHAGSKAKGKEREGADLHLLSGLRIP